MRPFGEGGDAEVPAVTCQEQFVVNGGTRIRYLDSGVGGDSRLPLIFSPGITDFADDYLPMFDLITDRRLLVVEMRGRGGSDAPQADYSARAQAGDLAAVVDDSGLTRFHLMTFSRGTTPAIELAMSDPGRVVTLSIGDYRAAEIGLPASFVEQQWSSRWRGVPIPDRVQRHVLEGIQAASVDRPLWDEVADLDVPVLVARGDCGGLVDDRTCEAYRRLIPGVEIVTIPGSGHDLFRPDRLAYPRAVLDFIATRAPGT